MVKDTLMVKDKQCPICNSGLFMIVYKTVVPGFDRIFFYIKCGECSHIWIDPVLSEKELFEEYKYDLVKSDVESFAQKLIGVLLNSSLYRNFFSSKKYITKVIKKYREVKRDKQKINYLDFGSGNASNLLCFGEIEPDSFCYGYERSQNAVYINAKNTVVENDISQIRKRKYDIITLFHVLEHIADLDEFFILLKEISHKKSLIVFQIPQSESLDFCLLKKFRTDFSLHAPYHLNFFSERSLRIIAKKYGFHVVQVTYNIYQIHSLIMNLKPYQKLILTPFMLLISLLSSVFRSSTYMTVILDRKEVLN